jgi:hypothetical protein
MILKSVAVSALIAGVIVSGPALADPAKFDGTWSVSTLGCSGRWTAQQRTLTAQAN